jgi:hypothetical protein
LKLRNFGTGCEDELNEKKKKSNISEPASGDTENNNSDDLKFTKNETIHLSEAGEEEFQLLCGHILEKEGLTEEEPMWQEEDVCVLWNHVPEEITLSETASTISYKFVMAVDMREADVRQEVVDGKCAMCT